MKKLLEFIIGFAGDSLLTWLKIECISLYARLVERLRGMFILAAMAFFFVIIAVSGFIFIHIALFIVLPWSPEAKGYTLLGLGIVYLFGALGLLMKLCSRRSFARACGLDSFARLMSSSSCERK